jgi:hypothetical protein
MYLNNIMSLDNRFEQYNDPEFVEEQSENFTKYVLIPLGIGAALTGIGFFGESVFAGAGLVGSSSPFVREAVLEFAQNTPQELFGQANFVNPNPFL